MIGAVPLYGTCQMSMEANALNCSTETWFSTPTPELP